MNILSVSGLAAGYGSIGVLGDIAFDIAQGDILGVLGHNGMGKSTLLKALSGAIRPSAGAVLFHGADIAKEPPHIRARRGLGYVPQGRQIFPGLTVRENMAFAARASGAPLAIVDEMLARFPRPSLILLDEPTEGIQPSIRDEIVETLLALRRELGFSVLLVEQNLKFMTDLADRVLHMEKGRLADAQAEMA